MVEADDIAPLGRGKSFIYYELGGYSVKSRNPISGIRREGSRGSIFKQFILGAKVKI